VTTRSDEILDKIKDVMKPLPLVTSGDLETWASVPFDEHVDYDFFNVLEADTPKSLNEASLGRIYQHVKRSGMTSWAILTSWQQSVPREVNGRNLKELKERVRKWGFFPLVGHGQEEDEETGEIRPVSEPSFFIVGIPLNDALELARRYNQWGMIFSGPDGDICLIEQGTVKERAKKFHPGKIAQFYSVVRGRPFVLESLASGWIEGLGRQSLGMTPIPGIPHRQSWSGVEWDVKEKLP
jgi:hypothetical protein